SVSSIGDPAGPRHDHHVPRRLPPSASRAPCSAARTWRREARRACDLLRMDKIIEPAPQAHKVRWTQPAQENGRQAGGQAANVTEVAQTMPGKPRLDAVASLLAWPWPSATLARQQVRQGDSGGRQADREPLLPGDQGAEQHADGGG